MGSPSTQRLPVGKKSAVPIVNLAVRKPLITRYSALTENLGDEVYADLSPRGIRYTHKIIPLDHIVVSDPGYGPSNPIFFNCLINSARETLTNENKVDVASCESTDVRNSILRGSGFLENNPRQLKRFINQFRLMVYICHEKGLFKEKRVGRVEEGLTLDRLAVWVAWSIRWPELTKELYDGSWKSDIQNYLYQATYFLKSDGNWTDPKDASKIVEILKTNRSRIGDIEPISHWLLLPWEYWLAKGDFRECIKYLECFWKRSEQKIYAENGQKDLLDDMLTMTSSLQTPDIAKSN
jgi:hypothetical protein